MCVIPEGQRFYLILECYFFYFVCVGYCVLGFCLYFVIVETTFDIDGFALGFIMCSCQYTSSNFLQVVGGVDMMQQAIALAKRPHVVVIIYMGFVS